MLRCDFAHLEREVRALEAAGARQLHLDVMDGLFVPNSTYGELFVQTFRRLTDLPLDVHLMIERPEEQIERYAKAGADILTFHVEATQDPVALAKQVQATGCGVGVALNPDTPVSVIESVLPFVDVVLIMSVQPGFGGQKFRPEALEKLNTLSQLGEKGPLLGIDGGVNPQTIPSCVSAGAKILVIGSAIFDGDDRAQTVAELQSLADV